MKAKTLLWMGLLLAACEGAPANGGDVVDDDAPVLFDDGKADGFAIQPGGYEADGILRVANTLTQAQLDFDVKLTSTAARNIVAARPFADVIALDAVSGVGQASFRAMLAYAQAQGWVGRCGDGRLNGPEGCDDGNTAGGDGCDAQCLGADVDPPAPVVNGVREGSYDALGILVVANTASLAAFDDEMRLDKRAAKNIFYGRQTGGAYDTLAKLDAVPYVATDAFGKLLAYARAHHLLPSCGDGTVQPGEEQCDGGAGCSSACRRTFTVGNAVVEAGEECDDGNARDGDGCSAAGAWEIAQAAGLDYANAGSVGTYRFVSGHFSARSGAQYWKLTITRPSHVSIDLLANNLDQPIGHDAFEAGTVQNAPNQSDGWSFGEHGVPSPYSRNIPFWRWYWDDGCSSSGCNRPDYDSVRTYTVRRTRNGTWDGTFDVLPGVYYLGFHTGAGNENYSPSIAYIAEIDVQANGPVCGDGQAQPGETCDDGAMADGDGCDRHCGLETLPESEPNDRRETAQPLRSFRRVQGTITAGDEDWYALAVGSAGTLTAHFDGCPFDGVLELYDSTGARVAIDDDGAGGYCPLLRLHGLRAGGYTLRVRHANARIAGGDYVLVLE